MKLYVYTFLTLVVVALGLSLSLSPPIRYTKISFNTNHVKSIQWDTGYGFNHYQENEFSKTNGDSSPFRELIFKRFTKIKQLKVKGHDDSQHILNWPFLDHRKNEDALSLVTVESPSGRELNSWFLFVLGVLIVGSAGCLILYSFRLNPIVSTVIILGLSLFYWFYFPGSVNAFNPMNSIIRAQDFNFPPDYSVVLQMFWAGLYEVFASVQLIHLVQISIYSSLVVILCDQFKRNLNRKWLGDALVLLLVFNPVSISYYLYLERSVTSGAAFFLVLGFGYLLLLREKVLSHGEKLGYLGALVFVSSLRSDNVPAIILFGLLFIYHAGQPRLLYMGLLILFTLTLSRWSDSFEDQPGWRNYYLMVSAEEPVRQMLSQNGDSIFQPDDLPYWSSVFDLSQMKNGRNYKCDVNFSNIKANILENQVNMFPGKYLELARQNSRSFLSSRTDCFWTLLTKGGLGWSQPPNSAAEYGLGLNVGYLPLDYENIKKNPRPANWLKKSALWPLASLFPSVVILILCVVLYRFNKPAALVSITLLVRLGLGFLFIPATSAFYFYDVYLLGIFLLVVRLDKRFLATTN